MIACQREAEACGTIFAKKRTTWLCSELRKHDPLKSSVYTILLPRLRNSQMLQCHRNRPSQRDATLMYRVTQRSLLHCGDHSKDSCFDF
eukprot:scaffold3348_cov74-Cylindrotheca_fusiformis.AAC.4